MKDITDNMLKVQNESEVDNYNPNDIDDLNYINVSFFDAIDTAWDYNYFENILINSGLNKFYKVYIDGPQITDDSEIQNALDQLPPDNRDDLEYYIYQEIEKQIKNEGLLTDYTEDDDLFQY